MSVIPLAAGLSLGLGGEQLVLGDDVLVQETKTRVRGELASVALEPPSCIPADAIQYWMYNGVAAREHQAIFRAQDVRYELTLLSASALGRERPKTLGHVHNAPFAGASTFPEIFEVIHGIAHFLFYVLDLSQTRATRCGWVRAAAGVQVVIPPNLYHLTINAGDTPLLFADLISTRARALYDGARATHGAPYFELTDGEWIPNPAFGDAAPLAPVSALRVDERVPLYTRFVRDPAAFAWLAEPAQFWREFPELDFLKP